MEDYPKLRGWFLWLLLVVGWEIQLATLHKPQKVILSQVFNKELHSFLIILNVNNSE